MNPNLKNIYQKEKEAAGEKIQISYRAFLIVLNSPTRGYLYPLVPNINILYLLRSSSGVLRIQKVI
jgi:hypothetical protein